MKNIRTMFKNLLLIILILCEVCFCYKILVVFPHPRKSHFILGEGFVRHLLQAGHEVTYITPGPVQAAPRLRQIDISSIEWPNTGLSLMDYEIYKNLFPNLLFQYTFEVSSLTALHPIVQELIHDPNERFDAVIIEYMFNTLLSGLASVFDCPLIWSVSMDVNYIYLSLVDDPGNSAYIPIAWSKHDPPFTLWSRAEQMYGHLWSRYYEWLLYDKENEIFMKAFGEAVAKRGRVLPSYNDVRYNASLILGNSNTVMSPAKRLPQAYKQIGGYHIKDQIEPLPEDLETIMNNATHGVIYFSLGSILRTEDMAHDMKTEILDVFRHLKQTVIWKFAGSISNIPKNVYFVNWAPQQSILAHRNCILFITHGGLLSLTEAMHVGLPVIGIPVFADQFLNVNRAMDKGYGRRVDVGPHLGRDLKFAVEDMLANPRYMEKAKEYSAIFHHRLVTPGVELVHSVEHVVLTRGAPHLRSVSPQVPFYQKMYLDLVVIIIGIVYIIIQLIKFIFVCIKQYVIKIKRD